MNIMNRMETIGRTKTVTMEAPMLDAEVIEIKSERPSTEIAREVAQVINEKGEVNLALLSPSQIDRCNKLNKSLVVTDINSISNYGADLQHTMTRYSNDFLKAVRGSQGGEVGELINNLLTELDYVDVDELKEPSTLKKVLRKIPILKSLVGSVEKVLHKYDSIQKNVDTIQKKIEVTRLTAMRDNNALQTMFENNIQYGKQVDELIIAGKLKLQEVNEQLKEMMENPQNYESHEIQDVQEFAHNLERRLSDMMTLRYVVKQSLPQIRTVQYNNIAIADKAQSIIATTIPVWKNQLSIAVALHNQKGNIEAHRRVTETTNTILRKNAEMLRQNSVEVARENERSVVDIETLRASTQQLIETIKEVKQIHEEGAAKRREAEAEIMKIESELDTSMTQIQTSMKFLN